MSTLAASLYTVGYEGRTLDELIETLTTARVKKLVDVRELPLSRRRGFSKTRLSNALEEAGIAYVHMRALGNPKENRERYWSGDVDGGAKVYRRQLHNCSHSALATLADSLGNSRICLLCFERDHATCHRDVIVESLLDLNPGLRVEHL